VRQAHRGGSSMKRVLCFLGLMMGRTGLAFAEPYTDRIMTYWTHDQLAHIEALETVHSEPDYDLLFSGSCVCEDFAAIVDPVTNERHLVLIPEAVTLRYLRTEVTDTVTEADVEALYDEWILDAHYMPTTWLVVARIPVGQVRLYVREMNVGSVDLYIRATEAVGVSLTDFIHEEVIPVYHKTMGYEPDVEFAPEHVAQVEVSQ